MSQTKAQLLGNTKVNAEPFVLPAGTTAERPSSAPNGTIRYNTTINSIEYYSSVISAWTSIQPVPQVTSVSPTTFNGDSGTTFTLTGLNFSASDSVKFITTGGTEYTAASVTFVSTVQLQATTPQDFSISDEPLDIKVTNSSGAFSVFDANIDCGSSPTWNTASGSLGSSQSTFAFSTTVSATDPDGATIAYSLASGSLPPNSTLNTSNGTISGTPPQSFSTTTYNFTINASDGINSTNRSFSWTVTPTNYFGDGSDGAGSL